MSSFKHFSEKINFVILGMRLNVERLSRDSELSVIMLSESRNAELTSW